MTPRRLTEEEIDALLCVCADPKTDELAVLGRALTELRTLRLSDEDRDLVAWMRGQMRATIFQGKEPSARLAARALALLDRLAGVRNG